MANGINFSGVGSGIDFGMIADAIMLQQSRPVAQLQSRRTTLDGRAQSLRQLNTLLASLTEAARTLDDRTLGTSRAATSSDTNIASATSTSDALPASYTLKVVRLASAHAESTGNFASTTATLLAGGETSVTLKLRTGGDSSKDVPITIGESNNSLAGLRDAINNANAGVTAAIIDVSGKGTENRLVLNSNMTGAKGRVELVDDSSSQTFAALNLAALNADVEAGDYTALDAKFELNGLTLYRSANTVSDALTGVTLNLKAAGTTSVSVAASTEDLNLKVRSFVDAYNGVQEFINAQYKPDGKGKPGGVLAGDVTLRSVQSQLRNAVGADFKTQGSAFSNLTQIGIGRDETGKLKLDTAMLGDKLKTSFADTKALLVGAEPATGLAKAMHNSFKAMSDQITGSVQEAIKGYTSSVASLDKTIAAQQERLDAMRASLTRRFSIVDAAIGQLNGQGQKLSGVISSLQRSNDSSK